MSSASPNLGSPGAVPRAELSAIDASTRTPVLFFLISAAAWLVLGFLLGLIASTQLFQPAFLSDCAWLTHGRVKPMAQNAFVYGWAFNAAFAVLIWIMARLSRSEGPSAAATVIGGIFWNGGVTLGLIGI